MSRNKLRKEADCLNCGAQVSGRFCSQCGQENIEQRENFFHLVGHFVSDYLHFDSKFFRSLIPLFTKPGFLTKQYWEGKRVRYIHPLRLFFFITIFFMLSTTYFYNRYGSKMKEAIKPDKTLMAFDSVYLATTPDTTRLYVPEWEDTVTIAEIKDLKVRHKRQLGKLAAGFDNFFKNLKYVTFLLLPVYALIFQLVYIRRKTYYVDQLVYAMHLQSFAYVLMSIVLMMPVLFDFPLTRIVQVLFFSMLIYVGFSLWYLYKQPVWKTVLKSFITTFLLFMSTGITLFAFTIIDAVYFQK